MSAIVDDGEAVFDPVKVLIALHPEFDLLDAAGPFEALTWAQHDKNDANTKAFRVIFAGAEDEVTSAQGATLSSHISYKDATARLAEIDVLIIPGGGKDLTMKGSEQIALVNAFVALQKKNPARERTLMSVCTASLALGEAGILCGLGATTHPDFYTKLEIICANASQKHSAEGDRTDVMEERFVVNNLRFELGENEDENPYVLTRKELKEQKRRKSSLAHSVAEVPNGRRTSTARKGSMSLKMSNTRRESIMKRANLRLGGLRVVTTGGVSAGIDGSLYLIAALVSEESAEEVARKLQWNWTKGIVVDGIDV